MKTFAQRLQRAMQVHFQRSGVASGQFGRLAQRAFAQAQLFHRLALARRQCLDRLAQASCALLAFGGNRGANIALMVEMLAAGVTGANWSLDAPSFMEGAENPGTGLFVVAIEPKLLDPDFERRAGEQVERLRRRYGVHSPGRAGAEAAEQAAARGVTVSREVVQRISDYASRYDG